MGTFVDEPTLRRAVAQLDSTADPFLRIWFVLKHMGLTSQTSVKINTRNSADDLERLFSFGAPDSSLYVPFSSRLSDKTGKSGLEQARSVVQTNIKQWLDGTGVQKPTHFLDVRRPEGSTELVVGTKFDYPAGLGTDRKGFAPRDGFRVALPELAWAIWYGRRTAIPADTDPGPFLIADMRRELHLSAAEAANVFVTRPLTVTTRPTPLPDATIYSVCSNDLSITRQVDVVADSLEENRRRVSLTQTREPGPGWLNQDPTATLKTLISEGHRGILLLGPPRTGKTRAVRAATGKDVFTIQIHDGWTYDHLIMGQELKDGSVNWKPGALVQAIRDGHKDIVLEEANRTRLSQAMGEVFSLLEPAYRGEENSIQLPDGSDFFVPEDTQFFFTVNNIDRSTEDLDDASFGRLRTVVFPPRVEELRSMLESRLEDETAERIAEFYVGAQEYYPLGHGYYADVASGTDLVVHYMTAVRPVLANHFEAFEPNTLAKIDNQFDEIVARA